MAEDTTAPTDVVATPPATPPPKADAEEGRVNYKEIVGLRKETREATAKVSELTDLVRQLVGTKSEPAKTESVPVARTSEPDAVTKLRNELAFKDQLAEAGVNTAGQRATLTKLWSMDNPSDGAAWIKATAESLGIKLGGAVADKAPKAGAASDQGDPAGNRPPSGAVDDLRKMSPAEIKALGPEKVFELASRITNGGGVSRHFANIKRAHEK